MSGLRAWFDSRSLREKRLLLAMAALAALTLVWAGIIRPVGDGLSGSRERYADAVERLGRTEVSADAVRRAARAGPFTGNLADTVRQQADAAGFTLTSLTPQGGDRVQAAIQSARPGALTAWLARLEQAGVLVDSASLTDNGDRTVGAALTFKARRP